MTRIFRGVAECLFAASLWFYPKPFRRRYGAEMREVFRDRRQDAGKESLPATAWMLADAYRAAGSAQCRAFGQVGNARVTAMLALLLLALLGASHRAQLATVLLDRSEQTRAWWKNRAMQTSRAFEREEQGRAAALLAEGSLEQQLVAALVLSQNEETDLPREENEPALLALVERASRASEPAHLHHALAICVRVEGCDWRATLGELQRRDSTNAAAWLLSAAALRATDPMAADDALLRAARAPSFRTVSASATAAWLEWSATRPFEAPWWQADPSVSAVALHYWRIGAALPAYASACSPPPVSAGACLAVAQRWHDSADMLLLRSLMAAQLHRAREGLVPPAHTLDALTLRQWQRRLAELGVSARPIDPSELAERLRSVGEVATAAEYAGG